MLFNSIGFAIFLPVVFILYWFVFNKRLNHQNILLLVASYFFYGCWNWRFLFLLIFSTFLDYYTGIKIHKSKKINTQNFWLWLSIIINLGFLGIFKYYNFFANSFSQALSHLGLRTNFWTLQVILPIGISFYTFHGLSYVIDIYRKRINPVKNFVDYSVFVSFFPLLVAGPIERATHLLPQIQKERRFNQTKAVDGLRQILWGLFKKVVIADSCSTSANMIFDNYSNYGGSTLLIGAVFFAIQIYCDFSGYSDIALGSARLFGIDLLRNFAFPYFSRDIAEFWRRWHISLSSWFRDYLYIPLGGSKGNTWSKVRNTFIIFLISGFWHGANWTFIAWGLLNAIYFLPLLLLKKNRDNIVTVAQGKHLPTIHELISMMSTFGLTVLAWVFFRAKSIHQAFSYLNGIFSRSLFSFPEVFPKEIIFFILLFFLIEWTGREQQYAIQQFAFRWYRPARWAFYFTIIFVVIYYGNNGNEFIYFHF